MSWKIIIHDRGNFNFKHSVTILQHQLQFQAFSYHPATPTSISSIQLPSCNTNFNFKHSVTILHHKLQFQAFSYHPAPQTSISSIQLPSCTTNFNFKHSVTILHHKIQFQTFSYHPAPQNSMSSIQLPSCTTNTVKLFVPSWYRHSKRFPCCPKWPRPRKFRQGCTRRKIFRH